MLDSDENATLRCLMLMEENLVILREHPSENHAVLNYESTSALSDFVQILCRVT